MPNPLKIYFDAHSIPAYERADYSPTDINLCGLGDKNSQVTACEAEVTCRACRRARVFREKFPAHALLPTDAEVQRSRKWLKAS